MAAEKKVLTLLYLYQCLHQNSKKGGYHGWPCSGTPHLRSQKYGAVPETNIEYKRTQILKWKNVEKLNSDLISPLAKIDLDGGGGVDGEPVVIKIFIIYHTLYIAYNISYIIYFMMYIIYVNCKWGTSCKGWSLRRRGQSRCRSAYSHILRAGW